jgi:uncharacterized protein YkwD
MRHTRTLAAALAVVAAVMASADVSRAAAQSPPCAAGAAQADAARAIVCLVNAQRAGRHRPPLRWNPRLTSAAQTYSGDMVAAGFFDHVAPDGDDVVDRVSATRYLCGSPGWSLGEALAWHTAPATPATIVAAWMASPPHRKILLAAKYRDIGVGAAPGVPVGPEAGLTVTAELGRRDGRVDGTAWNRLCQPRRASLEWGV